MQQILFRLHTWLRTLPDTQLWAALFVGRALLGLPLLAAFYFGHIGTAAVPKDFVSSIHSPAFLAYVLLVAPVTETLLECSLPHLILRARIHRHPWLFAIVSAVLMVVIHPIGLASVFPLLTGLLLAYCYLLFLHRHPARVAFVVTASFHIAINLAGLVSSAAVIASAA
jgi:hypothetical protein